MPSENLKGPEGVLLVSVDDTTTPTEFVAIPDQVKANILALDWYEHSNVTDVDDNFSADKADASTRKTVRKGWAAQSTIAKNGEITFTMLNSPKDPITSLILAAWDVGDTVPLWDLDFDPVKLDTAALAAGYVARGLAANFSLEIRPSKPVKGLQTYQVVATVESNPLWITVSSGADVTAIGTIGGQA